MSVPHLDVDPRVTRTRARVHSAAASLLGEVGLGGLTMEGIAERAGVGRSTLYRHWTDVHDLLRDALTTRVGPPEPPPAEDAIDAVHRILIHLVDAMTDAHGSRLTSALAHAAEQDPAIAEALHADNARRRQRLIDAIDRAVDAGDLPAETDARTAAYALAGAIVFARLTTPDPLTHEDLPGLMRQVLGIQPSR